MCVCDASFFLLWLRVTTAALIWVDICVCGGIFELKHNIWPEHGSSCDSQLFVCLSDKTLRRNMMSHKLSYTQTQSLFLPYSSEQTEKNYENTEEAETEFVNLNQMNQRKLEKSLLKTKVGKRITKAEWL